MMPAIFIGHGNPMLAMSDNPYSRAWRKLGESLPRPRAILSISAHWTTPGAVAVTAMAQPRTIHDFGGFPKRLYEQQYTAPGDPDLALEISRDMASAHIKLDHDWGLDHGSWTVLMHLFPKADIPVLQLSLDIDQDPQFHFDLGRTLSSLREKGILILGSGNMTHNLSQLSPGERPTKWALSFDEDLKQAIDAEEDQKLVHCKEENALYTMAHPSDEHYLPLLYLIAQRKTGDTLRYFNADFDLSTISMRSFILSTK
ncbi:MAG: 4,5-DOPA dioxygenase extradiol [Nitrospirae bacterium]|nr:4,5-DOPA dioxygenase extradiol [Candidatus Manganitrophaceae bacterium]